MKKILYFFLLSLFSISFAFGKKKEVKGKEINEIELQGSGYIHQSIPLENAVYKDIELINVSTREVSEIPDQVLMQSDFVPDVYIGTAKKQDFLNVSIPLYRNKNGKIEQLLSYDLSIELETVVSENSDYQIRSATSSVLAVGDWYKISVPTRGVYKIDYNLLQNMGLNPSTINPKNIRLFGNGGTVIPEVVDSNQADDLIENAIYVHASGSTFGQNDYVLFYANGPISWKPNSQNDGFEHTPNYYEDKSFYFLNVDGGPGKRIKEESITGSPQTSIGLFDDYAVIDKDSFSVGGMGKLWWSNRMNSANSASLTQNMSVNLGAISGPVQVKARVGSVSDGNGNSFNIHINNRLVGSLSTNANRTNFIHIAEGSFEAPVSNPNLNIKIQYNPAGNGAGYVDYLSFNYKRPIRMIGNHLVFRSLESLDFSSNEVLEYTVENANNQLQVWDITNPLNPHDVNGQLQGNSYHFLANGGTLREFVALTGSQFPSPRSEGKVPNQNLHGLPQTEYLIITNTELLPAGEMLADFHRQHYGTHVTVVTKDKIYNEFSSGGQDIGGIRNFIKMFYDRSGSGNVLNNVLFLGAASYDYKNRIEGNTNIVPTYQTFESANGTSSFSSDDYYGLLDQGENISSVNGMLDVGLGRIPAYNLEEAYAAVEKIKHYVSPKSFGPWKNVVSFVADDKDTDNPMDHLKDCETANAYFRTEGNDYNLYKIYSDAHQVVSGSGGNRYPTVNKAINDQIFNGSFLMSYSGHGNPVRWAHEGILVSDDYNKWRNFDKLPVMITATCDFGRFDDPGTRSAGAYLMLKADGGSIAMITTTQAVYASPNTELTKVYIQKQFEKDSSGKYRTLGEALTDAKNSTNFGQNSYKFVILGDPALRLSIPEYNIQRDSLLSIDGADTTLMTDTVNALGKYILKGSVTDNNGHVVPDFNGTVYVTVFDKKTTIETVNDFPGTTPSFDLQNNIVARIQSKVEGGKFAAQFIAPKDINYDFGSGKISFYAQSESKDASGVDTHFIVGGYNEKAELDHTPPIVNAYIDDEKFRDGGVTGPNPLLYVKLYDDNGINVSGTSLGHDLVAILDGDTKNPMVMNDFYQTEENDYRKGYVYFPLYNLPDGKHTIKVKAWDAHNNSGEGSVTFIVNNPEQGFISELYNYPNPVQDRTHFVFQHNQKGVKMDVNLQIFNSNGALVKEFKESIETNENRTELIWDGKGEGDSPLTKGVYFYKLHIKTEEGISATAYQKLVLLR